MLLFSERFSWQLSLLKPYPPPLFLAFVLQDDHSQATLLSPASLATVSVTSQPANYVGDCVERLDFSNPTLPQPRTNFDPIAYSTAHDTRNLNLDGAAEHMDVGYAAVLGQSIASNAMLSSTHQQEQMSTTVSLRSEINGHSSFSSLPNGAAVRNYDATLPLSEHSQPADYILDTNASAAVSNNLGDQPPYVSTHRKLPTEHVLRPRPASAKHGHGHRNDGGDGRSLSWRDRTSSEARPDTSGGGSGSSGGAGRGLSDGYAPRSVRPMSADTGTSSRPTSYSNSDARSVYVAKTGGGNHAGVASSSHLRGSGGGSGIYVGSQGDGHGANSSGAGAGAGIGGGFDGDGSSESVHRQALKRRELELASRAARLARRAGSPIGITLLELDERDMLAGKLAQEVQDAQDLRAQQQHQQGMHAGFYENNNYPEEYRAVSGEGGSAGWSEADLRAQQQREEQALWDQALRNQEDERQREQHSHHEVSEPHTPPTPSPRQPTPATSTHGARHSRDINNNNRGNRPKRPPWGGGASAAARHVAEVRAAALANASAAAAGLRTRNISASHTGPQSQQSSQQQQQQQSRTATHVNSRGRAVASPAQATERRGASAARPILSQVRRGMEVAPRSARKRGRDLRHRAAAAAAAECEGNPQAAPVDLHAHAAMTATSNGRSSSRGLNGYQEPHVDEDTVSSRRVTVAPTVGPLAAATAAARRRPANTRPATATVTRRQEAPPQQYNHRHHEQYQGGFRAPPAMQLLHVAYDGASGGALDYAGNGWVDFDSLSSGRPSREGRRPVSAAARVHMGAEWTEGGGRGVGRSGAMPGAPEGRGGPHTGAPRVHSSVSDDDDSGILDGDLCDDDPLDGYASGSEGSGGLGAGISSGAANSTEQPMKQLPLRRAGTAAGYSSGSSSSSGDDDEGDHEAEDFLGASEGVQRSSGGIRKAGSSPAMVNAAQLPPRPRSSTMQRPRPSSNSLSGFGSSHAVDSNNSDGAIGATPVQRPMSAGWIPHGSTRGGSTFHATQNNSRTSDNNNHHHHYSHDRDKSVNSRANHPGMSGREGRVAAAGAQLWRAARSYLAELRDQQSRGDERLSEDVLNEGPRNNNWRSNLAHDRMVSCYRALFFDDGDHGHAAGQCGLTQLLECLANMNVAATLLEAKELLRWIARDTNPESSSNGGGNSPLSISVEDFAIFVEGPEPGPIPRRTTAAGYYEHEDGSGGGIVGQHCEGIREGREVDDSAWEVLVRPPGAYTHVGGPSSSQAVNGGNGEADFVAPAAETAKVSRASSRRKDGTRRSRSRNSRTSNRGRSTRHEESHINGSGGSDSKQRYCPGLMTEASTKGTASVPATATAATTTTAGRQPAVVSSVPRAELDDLLMSLEQRIRCVYVCVCMSEKSFRFYFFFSCCRVKRDYYSSVVCTQSWFLLNTHELIRFLRYMRLVVTYNTYAPCDFSA